MKPYSEGTERKWFGMLVNFVGDIPASNFVAGFKEGVGAAKLHCRSCLIDRGDIELIYFHVLLYPKNPDESGKTITPKLHSLLHLANQIRMFGALRNSWCFRYESKNTRFKKIMNRNCNFSNTENFTVHGHHSPIDVKHAWWAHIAYETTDLISDSKFQPLKSLKIAGIICNNKTVFLMHPACSLESKPVFFRIADFFVAGIVYLVMEELVTTCFCPDRVSFCVRPLNIFAVVPCSELSFNAPMYSFYYDNEIHVIPNYIISNYIISKIKQIYFNCNAGKKILCCLLRTKPCRWRGVGLTFI